MEKYESWMKTWRTWHHKWIHSEEHITCFVLNAIPPNRKYSTNTHHLLSLAIGDACDSETSINYREKTIHVPDGSSMRPFIEFRNKKSRDNYPFTISQDVEFEESKTSYTSVDILDKFGIISYNLMDFKRVNILKIVKAMESLGFGVVHNGGIIKSIGASSCVPSDRFHIRLPYTDDPVWDHI